LIHSRQTRWRAPPPFDSKEPFTAIELKSAASPNIARAFIASLVKPAAQTIWNERGFMPAAEKKR
jgi:ABC-type molybdate transport system substrate-binding protein